MLSRLLVLVVIWCTSASALANDCDYESILFSYLAKQNKGTEGCFVIDPRDVSAEGEGVLSVKVRERHDKKCGGDPETMPSVGIFKVKTNACEIVIYDAVEDDFRSLY